MAGERTIKLPADAEIMDVLDDNPVIYLLALVDPSKPLEPREFLVQEIGRDLPPYETLHWLGKFQWHGRTHIAYEMLGKI